SFPTIGSGRFLKKQALEEESVWLLVKCFLVGRSLKVFAGSQLEPLLRRGPKGPFGVAGGGLGGVQISSSGVHVKAGPLLKSGSVPLRPHGAFKGPCLGIIDPCFSVLA
ncbi:MAG: hypothetical protein R3236_05255, partial [Phycisphaeraceae bacterium]|nr:hypothetical protein [Phycisphaeraceae bacterium]